MNVAIIGFGIEGKAAYAYWSNLGASITICDQDPRKAAETPRGVATQLGEHYLDNLDDFDVIVRSAGINPRLILAKNPGLEVKITTVVNEFLRVSPTQNIIGVTGTKGKGTTSTLVARMLQAANEEVFLGGNIGLPPLEFLPKLSESSWVVLELSSYQLADLAYSPPIAVCLMVVPEHLNWHSDMDDYILAKARLFEHQTSNDTAVYFADNEISRKVSGYSPGIKIPYFREPGAHVENGLITIAGQNICRIDELKLLGVHNQQNVCAAITVAWQITQNIAAMRSVLMTFGGLPHRLELIRELDGVRYYNDSFAATPDAAIAAMDAVSGSKVILLGGFDRQLPIDHLAQALAGHAHAIRKALFIGASAERLAGACQRVDFSNYVIETAQTMPEIVARARSFSRAGDAILLSPGFASFDMFKNFEDRGEQFKSVVERL